MPGNNESKELEQGNIMTECNKCSCHNWDKITLWKCGNSECAELYPDTNGSEWENKSSAELLKQLTTTQQALNTAVEALDYIADAQFVWINDEIVDEESLRPLREVVIKALAAITR